MKSSAALTTAFKSLGTTYRGIFIRVVPLRYSASPISAIGSVLNGGRYNAQGAFEVLYLSYSPDTAVREVRLVVHNPITNVDIVVPQEPAMLLTIEVSLQQVVDLRSAAIRKRLGVTRKTLLADWELAVHNGNVPETQILGQAASDAGVEGLIVPSARHQGAWNLNIIVDQLRRGSYVEIHSAHRSFPPATPTRIDGIR